MSESHVRRTSRTLPILLAGSDYICSGFGSVQRYDNMFGPSHWNAEDSTTGWRCSATGGVEGGCAPPNLAGCGSAAAPRLPRRSATCSGHPRAWPISTTARSKRGGRGGVLGSRRVGLRCRYWRQRTTIRAGGLDRVDLVPALLREPAYRPRRRSGCWTCLSRGCAATHVADQRRSSTCRCGSGVWGHTTPTTTPGRGTGYEPSAGRQGRDRRDPGRRAAWRTVRIAQSAAPPGC
jgi:propanediol dehydratase large subunit